VYELIWKLFLETGNVETYLLLKRIENEHPNSLEHDWIEGEIASFEGKR